MIKRLRLLWQIMRYLADEGVYEQYVAHFQKNHSNEKMLSKKDFFKQWQNKKWSGINRCC